VTGRFRVFLIGLAQGDLDRLRVRSAADDRLEIVGTALWHEIARSTVRLPDSIDGIMTSPAAWAAASAPPLPRDATGTPLRAGNGGGGLIEDMTARERDVLALVADGRPNREIAMRLGISEHTVKFHLASIFGKLGVSTRTQAVRRALQWGLIEI
jgi:DNA-binding CsgD family transcriptional regulator